MRIYFFSETPCALLSGGLFLGKIDGFERSFDCSLSDNLFLEAVPTNGASPVGFFLNRTLLSDPPAFLTVYDGANEMGIRIDFPLHGALKICAQLEQDGLFTLFREGDLQLSIEAETYAVRKVPSYLEHCALKREGDLLFLSGDEGVACYDLRGNERYALPLTEGKAYDAIGRRIGFRAEETLSLWLEEESFPEEKLPFAFLEAIRLKVDLSPYLSEELLSKKEALARFFPPFAQTIAAGDAPAILCKRKENLFSVKAVSFEYKGGKIDNVKLL